MPQIKRGYAGSAANLAKWREEQKALKESAYVLYDSDDDGDNGDGDQQPPATVDQPKTIVVESEKPKPLRATKPRVNKTDLMDKKLDELMEKINNWETNQKKLKEPEPIVVQNTTVPVAPIAQQILAVLRRSLL
ncbi:hypothetical protein SAMD00019534_093050 [Acytostelium subglobosum LB1]|uniref:hypothetical protein n=1 Tax=Acytostelium subglobosum LB1 TaxID=1410327 RepID=UPI000644FED7|nr:hypothetical protein SAMD00019534_093050 [Acytostelium subglobosum LB1]GAM26130.1 hypothetical protein SAMD00019534_093050 [Acytostelium subglobosum LB1]|eukprot:XP_012751173.1 hypothetical protein SAMD00019534_093050 [Acytostelium subglobosum LB1]